MKGHVVLVAFTVDAPDMKSAQEQLMSQLPNCRLNPGVAGIDSWYVAMDERHDGTTPADGASARFYGDPDTETVGALFTAIAGLSPESLALLRQSFAAGCERAVGVLKSAESARSGEDAT
jgi:hypothetical protein